MVVETFLAPFAVEVIADNSGEWCGNGMRYATPELAKDAAIDLFGRWMAVKDYRVVEYVVHPWLPTTKRVALARCKNCSTLKVDVRQRPDPYEQELKGDNQPVWLCDACEKALADEV